MADDNRNNDDRKNGDFKMPSRNWVVWIVIFLCVILVVLFHNQYEQQGEVLSASTASCKQLLDEQSSSAPPRRQIQRPILIPKMSSANITTWTRTAKRNRKRATLPRPDLF